MFREVNQNKKAVDLQNTSQKLPLFVKNSLRPMLFLDVAELPRTTLLSASHWQNKSIYKPNYQTEMLSTTKPKVK